MLWWRTNKESNPGFIRILQSLYGKDALESSYKTLVAGPV